MIENLNIDTSNPLAIAISGNAGAGKSTVSTEVAQRLGADTVVNAGRFYRAAAVLMYGIGIYHDQPSAVSSFATSIRSITQDGFGENQKTIFTFKNGDVEELLPQEHGLHTPRTTELVQLYSPHSDLRRKIGSAEISIAKYILTSGWPISGNKIFVMEGRDVYNVLTTIGKIPDEQILSIFLEVSHGVAARRRQSEPQFSGMQLGQIAQKIAQRDAADRNREHGSYGYEPLRDKKIETDHTTVEEIVTQVIEMAAGEASS